MCAPVIECVQVRTRTDQNYFSTTYRSSKMSDFDPRREPLPSSITVPSSSLTNLLRSNGFSANDTDVIRFWPHEVEGRWPNESEMGRESVGLDDLARSLCSVTALPSSFIDEWIVSLVCIARECESYIELVTAVHAARDLPRCIGQIQQSMEGGKARYKVMHNSSSLDSNDGICPKCGSAGGRNRFAVRIRTTDETELDNFPSENRSHKAYLAHIENQRNYESAVKSASVQRRRVYHLESQMKMAIGACVDKTGASWSLISEWV